MLRSFPTGELAATVKMTDYELPTQKVLGVYWNAETDRLEVRVSICRRACTRRGLLSMIGQTFDPIGVLQPFLLPAKRVLQQACRAGLPWDESISVARVGVAEWENWLENLPKLESVSVTRSFKILGKRVKGIELHVFCDASLTGYSACAYFRVEYDDGFVQCLFDLGKARVAPLKPVTVPRLELTAAVIAVKVAFMIRNEVEFYLDRIVFWCDATVVLRYINNTSSRYKSFVANRLELIHQVFRNNGDMCLVL